MPTEIVTKSEIIAKLAKKLGIKIEKIIERMGLNELGEIFYLNLSNCGVKNEHLSLISKFTSLKALELDNNQITETKGFKGLKNLTYLNLGNNPITSTECFKTFENLTYHGLQNKNIKNKIEFINNYEIT